MNKKNYPLKINLVHGNQQLLVNETTNGIIRNILSGRVYDNIVERFDIAEILKKNGISHKNSIDDFLLSLETLPMLSDIKIIRIDNFDLIKQTSKKNDLSSISRLYKSIESLIENMPDYLWLIFTSKSTKELDFNKKLYKLIKKRWQIQKFVSYDNSVPLNWVLERAKKKGLPFSSDIGSLFIEIVGNDLFDLDQEIEKMALYFFTEDNSEEVIKKNIRSHKHFSIFRMTESLSKKELLPALEILYNQLQASPNEHVRFFAIIAMQFRRLLIIHCMFKQYFNESEILKKIPIPPFLGKQLIIQAKNFSFEELNNIYLELANMDLKIKFQSSIAPFILQDFFQNICSGKYKKIP